MKKEIVRYACCAAAGSVATAASRLVTHRWNPSEWQRTSFSGAPVQLTGGLDAAVGSLVGISICAEETHKNKVAAALIAGVCAGAAGAIDDHCEARFPASGKGFKGHIGALRAGKITSGLLKILVIGAGAGVSAQLIGSSSTNVAGKLADAAVNTALIAGMANLINLLDLRPGRALKVTGVLAQCGLPAVAPGTSGALLGTCLAAAPSDLSGQTMLGDLGANVLGAQLGAAYASISSRSVRCAILAGIISLTAASEKVSFSQVIENNRILRVIDQWGRKPAVSVQQNAA